ncbi:FAD-binding oxidoreductase [Paraburkholderia sp. BR10872]|uniref:FAD-binding oxidoreductase n=1 Tax=unclassified Paraburkholderia TaxID=2615204 RepID=UPI0034D35AD2
MLTGQVSGIRQVSETTAILDLDAGAHAGRLDFLPGQYARLKVPGTDVWRSYSFASRPARRRQPVAVPHSSAARRSDEQLHARTLQARADD